MVDVFRADYLQDSNMEEAKITPDDFVQIASGTKTNMDYVWGGILSCIAVVFIWAFFQPQTASDLFDQLFESTAVHETIETDGALVLEDGTSFDVMDAESDVRSADA